MSISVYGQRQFVVEYRIMLSTQGYLFLKFKRLYNIIMPTQFCVEVVWLLCVRIGIVFSATDYGVG